MQRTVLLVDDDENILRGLARALRYQPFHIYTAHTADEAIDALKAHQVDVVVSDEHMPGMPGSRLLAWIAENCPEVMRIVLTGRATAQTAIRAINEGAVHHFFTKPCDPVQLAVVIRKALEHKQLVEENRRLLAARGPAHPADDGLRTAIGRLKQGLECEVKRPLRALCRRLESLSQHTRPLDASELLPLVRTALEAAVELSETAEKLGHRFEAAQGDHPPISGRRPQSPPADMPTPDAGSTCTAGVPADLP